MLIWLSPVNQKAKAEARVANERQTLTTCDGGSGVSDSGEEKVRSRAAGGKGSIVSVIVGASLFVEGPSAALGPGAPDCDM